MCPPNAIDTLLVQPVLLDDLAALDDDWGDVDVVPHHLIGKVQAERRPPVGEVCVCEARRAACVMHWDGRQLRDGDPE